MKEVNDDSFFGVPMVCSFRIILCVMQCGTCAGLGLALVSTSHKSIGLVSIHPGSWSWLGRLFRWSWLSLTSGKSRVLLVCLVLSMFWLKIPGSVATNTTGICLGGLVFMLTNVKKNTVTNQVKSGLAAVSLGLLHHYHPADLWSYSLHAFSTWHNMFSKNVDMMSLLFWQKKLICCQLQFLYLTFLSPGIFTLRVRETSPGQDGWIQNLTWKKQKRPT